MLRVWFLAMVALLAGVASIAWDLPMQDHDLLQQILWQIRVPRTGLAAYAGASLAVAGAAMQGLFRNPLVEPGLLGVSAGAGLGGVLALMAGAETVWLLPLGAATGAVLALGVVLALSRRLAGGTEQLLLAGIAINALAGAAINLVLAMGDNTLLRSASFWLMGSFAQADSRLLELALLLLPLQLILLLRLAPSLDLWSLGEGEAADLGLNVGRFRRQIVVTTALLVAFAVAQAGSIAFIGLLGPHIARRWVGAAHRVLLWASLWLGALLAVAADWGARVVVAPAELPVGVLTALLGAPIFLLAFWRYGRAA